MGILTRVTGVLCFCLARDEIMAHDSNGLGCRKIEPYTLREHQRQTLMDPTGPINGFLAAYKQRQNSLILALKFALMTAAMLLATTPTAAAPVQLKFGVFISPQGFSVKKNPSAMGKLGPRSGGRRGKDQDICRGCPGTRPGVTDETT